MSRTRAQRPQAVKVESGSLATPPPGPPSWLPAAAVVVMVIGAVIMGWMWSRSRAIVPPAPPNVVLVTLDTTRADRLGSYGYAAASTPTLDRLAADGIRFDRAISPAPLTLPAHASLMSGRSPYAHGVRNNGHFVLADDVPTLAERYAAAGYDTAAFVSSFVLDRQFGLARGFAHYDDALDPPRGLDATLQNERRGDRTVAAATAWLTDRDAASRPYFVWVHLYDAHDPYTPPPPFAERFAERPYDGEIAFTDALVGELLTRAGYGASSGPLVVVAGDHGESLGEHGESTHGLFVYEGALRVPLLMAWPGVLRPRVVEPAVALVDVAPTLLRLSGLPPLEAIDGRDLRPVVAGESALPSPSYAETYFPQFFMGWAPLRTVRDGRWKFIDGPDPELYDLASDPGETANRFADEPSTARTLKRQLETMAREGGDRSTATTMSDEARQRLSALGYVSTPVAPAVAAAAPDPKRMVALHERLIDGNRALSRDDAAGAVRIANGVLAADSANPSAQLLLGRAQLAAGRPREAIAALRAYLTAVPTSADAHHWMALAHLRAGDRVQALKEEDATLALDPRHASAIALRAGLLFSAGRRDEGVEALRAAVAADPLSASLRVDFADLLADAGRTTDAEAEYRRVMTARPGDLRARLGLGVVLAASGQVEPAITELTRVLEAAPRHDEARFERARAFERAGQAAEARADYEALRGDDVRPDLRRAARERLTALSR